MLKKWMVVFPLVFFTSTVLVAQCVICTKTASSLDDNAARGLNNGIIYLAFMPLLIMGIIGYIWWSRNRGTV
jgi:hypothetical protein